MHYIIHCGSTCFVLTPQLIDLCLTPTLAVLQLYRGVLAFFLYISKLWL